MFNNILAIGNWELSKADKLRETDELFPVEMLANRLRVDRENEELTKAAFDKDTCAYFVNHGIIDWHHQSVLGTTMQERAAAILGAPTDFEWRKGLPWVVGNLTKAHPINRDFVIPHLKAGNNVYGGSVGGSKLKAVQVYDPALGRNKTQVNKIHWNHIAIAGRPYVMSPGSEVRMVKAVRPGDPEAEPTSSLFIEFSDLSSFETDFDRTLAKALEIGAGTDSAQLQSLDASRMQSLEGADDETKKKKRKERAEKLVKTIIRTFNARIVKPSPEGLKLILKAGGFSDVDAEDFADEFIAKLPQILKRAG